MKPRSSWKSVRQTPSDALHAMHCRLSRQFMEDGTVSEAQEGFWDQVIAELEWRSARSRRGYKRCRCEVCRAPEHVGIPF